MRIKSYDFDWLSYEFLLNSFLVYGVGSLPFGNTLCYVFVLALDNSLGIACSEPVPPALNAALKRQENGKKSYDQNAC